MKIEDMTYDEVKKVAEERMEIKGHECFFAELYNGFGYSALIFKDGKHIHHANDYALHHSHLMRTEGKDTLRQCYIEEMGSKLFTDEELLEEISTYNEYDKKMHFLRNYWIMRHDYLSVFCIGEKERAEWATKKTGYPFYNPVSFCYVADSSIVETQGRYLNHLEESFKILTSQNDTFREMISCELDNHEACITGDYTDALRALGLSYEKLTVEQQKIVKKALARRCEKY